MKKTICIIVLIICILSSYCAVYNMGKNNFYPRNSNGQTYGSLDNDFDYVPDLILVEMDDGIEGYVLREDFNINGNLSNPEEALKRQEELRKEEYVVIPVYKKDGETVIGEFEVSTNNEQELY